MSHWFGQGFKLPRSKVILIITHPLKKDQHLFKSKMGNIWHIVHEVLRYRIIIRVLGRRRLALPAVIWQLMKSGCNFTWKSQIHTHTHVWCEKSYNGAAWTSSWNKGGAKLHPKCVRNRQFPLSNDVCMFMMLHSLVSNTGKDWGQKNNWNCVLIFSQRIYSATLML